MKKANLHPREAERLQALTDLNILDTLSENDYDEITQMASLICNTPIALISLVDDKRQWFKSKVGLGASETPKDIAFCSHAILQNEVFIIPDSSKDERFFDNPLVTSPPHVQFYAGTPLLDPSTSLPIGTLCVIDNKARTLEPNQITALKMLSNQISRLLDLRTKIKALKALNEKLQFQNVAFENMSEGIIIKNSSGHIIDHNHAALEILGLSENQLASKAYVDLEWICTRENGLPFTPNEHPSMIAMSTGMPQKNIIMGIEINITEKRWLSINSIPIFLNNEKLPSHSVSTFTNITNEKITQQALFQSAKMSSLGEMASDIAHEINNPLSIILANACLLIDQLNTESVPKDSIIKALEKIKKMSDRMNKIIKGLLYFSRDAKNDGFQSVSISKLIEESISLCEQKLKNSGVKIDLNLPVEDVLVVCSGTEILQILVNLINNSFDAIKELSVKWINIEVKLINNSQSIECSITDSGNGIPKELADKIMQPFFTTKEIGHGTGLGLSISTGIIKKHKGKFYLDTNCPNTKFVIEIPLVLSS